ncbi:MAG: acyl--CoA ligase [Melioribacteraceae bacterium]|nr:acyl--CoA ligase [Melioribacteraceae bacterium]
MISNSNHWLFQQSINIPDKVAIISAEQSITYHELFNLSKIFANYLIQEGITPKTNVGILVNHSFEFFIILNSIWLIGAVAVPLNPNSKLEELEYQIKKTEIFFLISNDEYFIKQNLNVNLILYHNNHIKEQFNSTYYNFNKDESALIMFTSGSTAKPKAVVHTFNSLYNHVNNLSKCINLSSDDFWLLSLPLYHIGGFMILIRSLILGSTVIFPNSLKANDIAKSFNFSPTHASFVSTMLNNFYNDNILLPKSLKYIFLGGGPIDNELFMFFKDHYKNILKVYGSTETCSMVTLLFQNDNYNETVGKPINEFIEIRINTNENERVGEILIKSNSLFKEYYNDYEETIKKFENDFYKTGDFGYLNDNGYLVIENRREDIIITGGKNVSRNEVESEIKKIKNVEDVYVFGLSDKHWGQKLCALIQTKNIDEEEIKKHLNQKFSSYKIPKQFYFTDKIPKNELGKISKKEILSFLNLNED